MYTVLKGYQVIGNLEAYNGIEPNMSNCYVTPNRHQLLCKKEIQTVLNDGDIGPTHSVNLSDPHQGRKFFVWNDREVTLHFPARGESSSPFNVSYIDIYTLSVPSAGKGSPGTTTFTANTGPVHSVTTQSCSFSSSTNTLFRSTYTVSLTNITTITIRISFPSSDIDRLFISEIQLCEGTPPSSILCSVQPLSYPPSSGATVTPDLSQPDSVSLTCSVASPPTDDYQYQWQWWKNGTQLNNDNRLTITHPTNTQSSSLQISDLKYSDEGEYMCRVQYAICPDGVDCREATPVTGRITLNLPGIFNQGRGILR